LALITKRIAQAKFVLNGKCPEFQNQANHQKACHHHEEHEEFIDSSMNLTLIPFMSFMRFMVKSPLLDQYSA